MKTTHLTVATAVAAALFGTAANTQAQYAPAPANPSQDQYAFTYDSPREPMYMEVSLGGNIVQDTKVRNAPGWGLSFEPGIRADFTIGGHIGRIGRIPLDMEFETGLIWNALTPNGFLTPPNQDGNLVQVPVFLNLVLNLPLNDNLSLYVGAGPGLVASEINLSAYGAHASDTDYTFAYQAKAGVKYAFAPNMEVGLGYKFMGTLSHSWFNDNPFLTTSTDPIYSHSFLASFTYRF